MNLSKNKIIAGVIGLVAVVGVVNTQAIVRLNNYVLADNSKNLSSFDNQKQSAQVIKSLSKTEGEIYKRGDKSSVVLGVQKILTQQGLYKGDISGVFGLRTEKAVSTFQSKNNLKVTGVLDSYTLNMITGKSSQVEEERGGGSATINAKVFLGGSYNPVTGLMSTYLNDMNFIPQNEPYTDLGYDFIGGGNEQLTSEALSAVGANRIVDWVIVETRWGGNSLNVFNSQAALLQADGDIVGVDGVSPVVVPFNEGLYNISIRHRNHLGVMTQSPADTNQIIDFSIIPLFGNNASKIVNGVQVLWPGDVNMDREIKYTGSQNDRDMILSVIGGVVPTNTISGYYNEDVNMDGVVKYTGSNNDRDIILQSIGGIVPTTVIQEQSPDLSCLLSNFVSSSATINSAQNPGERDTGIYQITFSLTSVCDDILVSPDISLNDGLNTVGQGFEYGINDINNSGVFNHDETVICQSCLMIGDNYRISEGETEQFTLYSAVQPLTNGSFSAYLDSINWGYSTLDQFYEIGLGPNSQYSTQYLPLSVI